MEWFNKNSFAILGIMFALNVGFWKKSFCAGAAALCLASMLNSIYMSLQCILIWVRK